MTKLLLISFELCPYAQRARIVLNEKNIDYDLTYIELSNKPDWFLDISPTGKVPILKVGDFPLFETNAICEYINELASNSLFPKESLERAKCRSWIEFGSGLLSKISILYSEKGKERFEVRLNQIKIDLKKVELQLQGPYFSGSEFGIVDATYATLFRYLDIFKNNYNLDLLENLPKAEQWKDLLLARGSVIEAVLPTYYVKLYEFFQKKESYLSSLTMNK